MFKPLKSYLPCDVVSMGAQRQTSKGVLIFEEAAFFPCKSHCKSLLLISGQDAYIKLLLQIGTNCCWAEDENQLTWEGNSLLLARRGSCLGASLNFRSRLSLYCKEPKCITAVLNTCGSHTLNC